MRSGGINIDSNRLGNGGYYGYLWMDLATSILGSNIANPGAQRLSITPDKVFAPGGAVDRWLGFPLGCLACLLFWKNVSKATPVTALKVAYIFLKM